MTAENYDTFLLNDLKKSFIIISRAFFRAKILFNKKLFDLVETVTYFKQMPYSKNVKFLTKLDNFLLNNIFIQILILFF